MGGFGVPMVEGKELDFQEYDLDKAKEYALSFTWKRSADLWTTLIEGRASPQNPDEAGSFSAPPLGVVGAAPYTGDEANLPASGAEPGPYLDVESGMIGVNEIVPPYVEVDSTGIVVKGDETEIIHL
jgi:hypothetical protein